MFTGNMVTEAIPARVFALYKIVASKKEITKSDLKDLMEPKGISQASSYFSSCFKTAIELKLLTEQDGLVKPLIPKEKMKNIEDLRLQAISVLPEYEENQFWKCSNLIVNMNEKIYQYNPISDTHLLHYLSSQSNQNISAPMIRGWRFWSQFLGFGLMNDFAFLPNAYIFIKDAIKLMDLEKNTEYTMDDFMIKFAKYGKILLSDKIGDHNLNIAMSSGLRQLHDNNEIILKHGSDQEMNWFLYPSSEAFNQPVSTIIYKGVR